MPESNRESNLEPGITVTEAARLIRCNRNTILAMISRGEIAAIKRGRDWHIYGTLPAPESVKPGRKTGPQARVQINMTAPKISRTISLKSIPKRNRIK